MLNINKLIDWQLAVQNACFNLKRYDVQPLLDIYEFAPETKSDEIGLFIL